MSDIYFLDLYTKLCGFRIVVLANRLDCESDFAKALHDRLIDGIETAADAARRIMRLEREASCDEDRFIIDGEIEMFSRHCIVLLDELEIDFDTGEYRINGGDWVNAVTSDYTGVTVRYPTTTPLTDDELGSLALIVHDLAKETGVWVSANRVVFSMD